ncbi:MAG: hypothetical protein IKS85_02230 [Lachnospiraceae bacterium]|nr:hypothetical protein [Lachnospiraceae bacterium]
MNHKMLSWLEAKIKPLMTKERLLMVLLGGILLLVISWPVGKKEAPLQEREEGNATKTDPGQDGSDEDEARHGNDKRQSEEDYVRLLETELEEILSCAENVGKVRVMIFQRDSGELVLEKDEKRMEKETSQEEKKGREVSREEQSVFLEDNGERQPFVVKRIYPKIEGVIVVAQGAGRSEVRTGISEALQAFLGIEAHRIKVLKWGNISGAGGIE